MAVKSDGSYAVTEPAGGGAATVFLLDANGKVVMLGHVDTSNPSFNDISPTSTAVEILFIATGAFTLPQGEWDHVYTILAAAPETATLAGVISARMLVNPTAVGDMDADIVTAINTAVASLMPSQSTQSSASAKSQSILAQAANNTLGAQATATVGSGSLSVKTAASDYTPNPGYGLIVAPSDDHYGIVITNQTRINRMYFVFRTGSIPSDGLTTDTPYDIHPWDMIETGFIPSVTGTSGGFVGTIFDYFSGSAIWEPKNTPTIPLTLDEEDVLANSYRVYVVGMGATMNGPDKGLQDYGDTAVVSGALEDMCVFQVTKELLWPLLTKILPCHPKTDVWAAPGKVMPTINNFVKQAGSVGYAWQTAYYNDPDKAWDATKTLLKAAVGGAAGQNQVRNALYNLVLALTDTSWFSPATNGNMIEFADKLLSYVKVADAALAIGDAGSIGYQVAKSNTFNVWDALALAPKLTLTPADATFSSSTQTVTFSVKVTGYLPASLIYEWGGSSYGTFQTKCYTNTHVICAGSQTATYSLTDNTKLPEVSGDTFWVKVYDSNQILIGTLNGVVNFQGSAVITPSVTGKTTPEGAHIPFTVSITNGAVPAGTNVTWTLTPGGTTSGTINGGTAPITSTSLKVTYVAPLVPVTDLLEVKLTDTTGKLLGRTSTLINVGPGLSLSPESSVSLGAQQTFTLSGANGFVLPANASYKWSLKGDGTLNATTTTSPSVTYTAPGASTTDTLTVQVTDLSTGNIAAQQSWDIYAGIGVWKGTAYTITDPDGLKIQDWSSITFLEYYVDATHVYFSGTSTDSHGYSYEMTCGTKSAPLTLTDNGDGTYSIPIPNGCYMVNSKGCTTTIPFVTLTQSATALSFPGATYTWNGCSNLDTQASSFTLYKP